MSIATTTSTSTVPAITDDGLEKTFASPAYRPARQTAPAQGRRTHHEMRREQARARARTGQRQVSVIEQASLSLRLW
jgi:hypothetical protein